MDYLNSIGGKGRLCFDNWSTGSVSHGVDSILIAVTHSDPIRSIINRANKVTEPKGRKTGHDVVDLDILTEAVGLDRHKNRIWRFDGKSSRRNHHSKTDSGRFYQSGNPFKRPCPLVAISSNRNEMQALLEQFSAHGSRKLSKPKGSGTKGRLTAGEASVHRKALKGIEDEKWLAERIEEMMPAVEKEEAVS